MLGKLLKYELKNTSRVLLPVIAIPILMSIFNRILIFIPYNNIDFIDTIILNMTLIVTGLYIISIISVFVLVVIVLIHRFYVSLLGKSGYLYFTLPVKSGTLILSHIISSMIWVTAGIISILISFAVCDFIWIIFDSIKMIFGNMNSIDILNFVLVCLIGFAAIMDFIMSIQMSLSIGHLSKKNRALASFGAYAGLYVIQQILIVILITSLVFTAFGEGIFYSYNSVLSFVLLGILFLMIAILSIYFFVTKHILGKKLNLQ